MFLLYQIWKLQVNFMKTIFCIKREPKKREAGSNQVRYPPLPPHTHQSFHNRHSGMGFMMEFGEIFYNTAEEYKYRFHKCFGSKISIY
jgi:hypothetical protein